VLEIRVALDKTYGPFRRSVPVPHSEADNPSLSRIITGGNTGIGRAAALAYADEGADVAMAHIAREPEAHSLIREIEKKAWSKYQSEATPRFSVSKWLSMRLTGLRAATCCHPP